MAFRQSVSSEAARACASAGVGRLAHPGEA